MDYSKIYPPEKEKDQLALPPLPNTPDAVSACEAMLPEVLRMYRDIVNDPDAAPAARIAAGQAIENRALGRAKQTEDKPKPKPAPKHVDMTQQALRLLTKEQLVALSKLGGGGGKEGGGV